MLILSPKVTTILLYKTHTYKHVHIVCVTHIDTHACILGCRQARVMGTKGSKQTLTLSVPFSLSLIQRLSVMILIVGA
jgi:hypothetical protein